LACSDDAAGTQSALRLTFEAGRTYWIAVSACCTTAAVGGQAVIRLYGDRPGAMTWTVTRVRSGDVSGRLYVEGRMRCATPSVGAVEVLVSQRVGDGIARGYGYASVPACDVAPVAWRLHVDSETGVAFRPGRARLDTTAASSDGFDLSTGTRSATVPVTKDPNARRGG
jgi:hypothetical protein